MSFTDDDRAALEALLRLHSVRTGTFELASGKSSNVYCDIKKTGLSGQGAWLIGRGLWALVRTHVPDAVAVGGLTLGADPLVTGMAIAAHLDDAELAALIVRKQAKGHGTRNPIEAPASVVEGARVVAVDDVVTTAGSTIQAIEAMRNAGYMVEHAVCVVDRQDVAREALAQIGVTLHALYVLEELVD
ncbi:MAG: orotate phosphoribosyltransferase [Myxococcota bacterium]